MIMERTMKNALTLASLSALFLLILPDTALAGGINEFTSPLETVMNTITGKAGRAVAIIGLAACGVVYIWKKDDLSGGFQLLLGVVFGISFIAFAANIVDQLFTFSGAVI